MSAISKIIKSGFLSSVMAVAMGAPSFAGGDVMSPVADKSVCGLSANVALTTDYVFRGISQTNEDPAVQGGVDVACGIFYAGIWGSNVDLAPSTVEVDFYAGIKKVYKGVTFDVGAIYYTYDDADDTTDIKVAVSGDVSGISLGATAYFNVDADVNAYELAFEKSFAKVSGITPTVSAMIGTVDGDDAVNYSYWNAGVSLGFAENYAVDLRYHDTDLNVDTNDDARFVATLSASF